MQPFNLSVPNNKISSIILSVPHCGIAFPADIREEFDEHLLPPDDTDWYVDRLYAFAKECNLTLITANYSRWVIDLNRDPFGKPLYNDGRIITALCPATNFLGKPLYKDKRTLVSEQETERRKKLYFDPYHLKLQELLNESKKTWGETLLVDCHSIRRMVPTIQANSFPDINLGSADGKAASAAIITTALEQLGSQKYSLTHNHPFKGGYITRSLGKPELQQHALQIEMAKPLYMDDTETNYNIERATDVQQLLIKTLLALQSVLKA